MNLLVVTAMSCILVGGIFTNWRNRNEPDLDHQVLNQLKKAGSDLSKPHNIDFFLYFPSEALASEGALELKAEVDRVRVQRGADKKDWLCLATKRMIPKHKELVRLRKRFNEIASKYDGEYDGWGTEVEK